MSRMGSKKKAFYEAPSDRPMASAIINEARSGVKPVSTKRPYTPNTDSRSLFGFHNQRSIDSRPPSVFSLGSKNFDTSTTALDINSRPNSGSKLNPLNKSSLRLNSGGDSKPVDDDRRFSGPFEVEKDTLTTEVERHKFQNVSSSVKSRTNSLSNLLNENDKEQTTKPPKKIVHSESFASGLPPTSPTRNKPKSKPSTSSNQQPSLNNNSDKRIMNSSESLNRIIPSGDTYHQLVNIKVAAAQMSNNVRPDSGSSCSSSSSTTHQAYRTRRYRTRSQNSQNIDNDESETPRPPPQPPSTNNQTDKNIENKSVANTKADLEQFFQSTVAPILDILSAPVEYRKKDSAEDFINLTKLLYSKLDERNLLGKHCSFRPDILKAVFKILDSSNPVLVMSAARIIIALKVRDVNLTNICKLIFKVSKNKANDNLFHEFQMSKLLVDTLASIKPEQNSNALLYLMCTLKFLTEPEKSNQTDRKLESNVSISNSLVKHGIFEVISTLIRSCVELNVVNNCSNKSFCDFLKQCFSCLNNLESSPAINRKHFILYQIPIYAVTLIKQYRDDSELLYEVCRLLSRLTQHTDCCQEIESMICDFCPCCLNIMQTTQNDHLVLRIAFIIGDLLTKSEDARLALFPDKQSLDIFLKVFHSYIKKFQSTTTESESFPLDQNEKESASVDDIVVKLIRVIANAAITESVGRMISSSKTCLRFILTLMNSKKILEKEELLSICISALNNISFYMNCSNGPDIKNQHALIIECLYKIIANKNGNDHLGGVIRVLGNLSRETYMRNWIVDNQLDEFLMTMLDSENQDTVFFTVGVLLNLMTDQDKRGILLKYNGVRRLIDVLQDFAFRDWQLAGLVCQTFWNYTEKIPTTTESILGGEENAEELLQLLTLFTDAEEVKNNHLSSSDENTYEYLNNSWQSDFMSVATDLITRLEEKMNKFEPL